MKNALFQVLLEISYQVKWHKNLKTYDLSFKIIIKNIFLNSFAKIWVKLVNVDDDFLYQTGEYLG